MKKRNKIISMLKKVFYRLRNKLRHFFFKDDLGFKFDFKLKPGWRFLKSLRIKNVLLVLFSPVFILFFYYAISFLSINKETICLETLKRSFNNQSCRDDCVLNRLENKKCILDNFKKNSKLEKKIFNLIAQKDLDFNFRKELIDIIRLAYKNQEAPSSLLTYLESSLIDEKIKAEIFKAFDWEVIGKSPLFHYLNVLNSDASLELRLAAALKISIYHDQQAALSVDDLEILQTVIFKAETPSYLRQSLVLLLGDYQKLYPEATKSLLAEIEQANFPQDNISRAFAADLIGLELPEISQAEWDDYYKFTN